MANWLIFVTVNNKFKMHLNSNPHPKQIQGVAYLRVFMVIWTHGRDARGKGLFLNLCNKLFAFLFSKKVCIAK